MFLETDFRNEALLPSNSIILHRVTGSRGVCCLVGLLVDNVLMLSDVFTNALNPAMVPGEVGRGAWHDNKTSFFIINGTFSRK